MASSSARLRDSNLLRGTSTSHLANVGGERGRTLPKVNLTNGFGSGWTSLKLGEPRSTYYTAPVETSNLQLEANPVLQPTSQLNPQPKVRRPLFETTIPGIASVVEPPQPIVDTGFKNPYYRFETKLFTWTCFASLILLFLVSISSLIPFALLRVYFYLVCALLLASVVAYCRPALYSVLRTRLDFFFNKPPTATPTPPQPSLVDLHTKDLSPMREVDPRKVDTKYSELNHAFGFGLSAEGAAHPPDLDAGYRKIFSDVAQEPSEDRGLLGLLGGSKAYLTLPVELPKVLRLASGEFTGFVNFTAQQTLDMICGTTSPRTAIYKTRVWLANQVLAPLLAKANQVDAALKAQSLSSLSTLQPNYFYGPTPKLGIQPASNPRNLLELYQSNPESTTVADRLRIERYINVPLYQTRSYIIQRITELASHGFLSNYKWDGGSGGNKGYSYGKLALPTDAELLVHLFITFMDWADPTALGVDSTRFSANHYLERGAPLAGMRGIFIKQVTLRPPHYVVVCGGKVFELPKGDTNLFWAIYTFAYLGMRDHAGYVSGIPLSAPEIGLDTLVR